MRIKCNRCSKVFDDEFRTTICPHETFAANDGANNFRHHSESPITDDGIRIHKLELTDPQLACILAALESAEHNMQAQAAFASLSGDHEGAKHYDLHAANVTFLRQTIENQTK